MKVLTPYKPDLKRTHALFYQRASSTKQILMAMTSQDCFPSGRATGLWVNDFAIPFQKFVEKGLAVTVASPKGGKVPVDPQSQASFIREALMWYEATQAIGHSIKFANVNVGHYDALFLPGGYGPLYDLPENQVLHTIIRDFYESGKLIAAISQGVAALVKVTLSNGDLLVAGKTLTGFDSCEERNSKLKEDLPFSLDQELREKGANFVSCVPSVIRVERDGQLITAQNHQSSDRIAQVLIEALQN